MGWSTTGDFEEYEAAVGGLLTARPAENTVLLTVAESLRARGASAVGAVPPAFGWWRSADGVVAAAFLLTPPYPVLLTRMPAAAVQPLAAALAQLGQPVSGVNAPLEITEAFAAAWAARTGARWQIHQRQRLHRLGELKPPAPAPDGGPRAATGADIGLLVVWWDAFAREAGVHAVDTAGLIADRIGYGGLILWETGGTPVSLAGVSRQVAGMIRIGPVYTPPEHRGRGYASAVTAAASRTAEEAGARQVLLFTDVANPTSDTIYQRLGYQPLEDRLLLTFTS